MGCLRNWVSILKGVGHKSLLIVGLIRSRVNIFFFECVPYDSQRLLFFGTI